MRVPDSEQPPTTAPTRGFWERLHSGLSQVRPPNRRTIPVHRRVLAGVAIASVTALVVAGYLQSPTPAKAASGPTSGVVCTTASGTHPSFALTAESGMINMPDGKIGRAHV